MSSLLWPEAGAFSPQIFQELLKKVLPLMEVHTIGDASAEKVLHLSKKN